MKQGLTLIELLIVMAVIAILAALLMSVFRTVRSQAEGTVCLGNLRQMQLANSVYGNEWRGRFTPIGYVVTTFGTYAQNSDWPSNKLFLQLITDGKVNVDSVSSDQSADFLIGLICPVTRRLSASAYSTLLRKSYAYNTQDPKYPRTVNTLLGPTMRMPKVSERLTFIDSIGWELTNTFTMTSYTLEDRWDNQVAGVVLRHRNRANMAFGDGSARSLPWDSRLRKYDSGLWNP